MEISKRFLLQKEISLMEQKNGVSVCHLLVFIEFSIRTGDTPVTHLVCHLKEVRLMFFFMDVEPPTVTAQERRVRIVNGHPMFYDSPKIKTARKILTDELMVFSPDEPISGPIAMHVEWHFTPNKSHKSGEWRITRPDTDNLEKLLKDCMTAAGFWNDDAQVCFETVKKRWDNKHGIGIVLCEIGDW